jgi:hypothetical protein
LFVSFIFVADFIQLWILKNFISGTDAVNILWRTDPLLSSDSVNSDRCYGTQATTEEPVSKQRIGKHNNRSISGNGVFYLVSAKWS